jgi:hypoxanthine phosphoribosyltransferase
MLISNLRNATRVITLDKDDFDTACAELMRVAEVDFQPDVMIGIRTGGLYVADAMAKAAERLMQVLPITCRRPSTRYKPFSAAARRLVAGLPRPILDQLRVVEHRLLTRKPAAPKPYHFDAGELAGLRSWFHAWTAAEMPRILVVDDSVDTGATMQHVLELLRSEAGMAVAVRTAAITVTTERPTVMPDYVLLRQQLCRFPWSLDAGVQRAC